MRDASSLFISDLHLCSTRPGVADLFFRFLDLQASHADALYILGDLFEYWAGDDDDVDSFNASICHALKGLTKNGTQVFFIPGNRDFLVGPVFAETSGAILLEEPHLITLFGQPTLLLHGDTLCSDDIEYSRFRTEVRDPVWRKAFLALPLAERKIKIKALRQRSENEKQVKLASIMDVNANAVADLLRTYNYPHLIHGHTHRQSCHTHIVDGRRCKRWVLGDWDCNGNYLSCDESGLSFHTLIAS